MTLVEMLVALLILGLTVGIFGYIVNAFRFNRNAQVESQALGVARSYVDSTRALWKDDTFFLNAVLPSITLPAKFKIEVTVTDREPISGTAATVSDSCTATATMQTSACATLPLLGYKRTGTSPSFVYTPKLNPNPSLREMTVTVTDTNVTTNPPKATLSILVLKPTA